MAKINSGKGKESDIQLVHLNANMGVMGVRDRIKDSVYGTLSFFLARTPESIYAKSDIKSIVEPFIQRGGDIIGFTEIFGKQQLDIVVDLLESKGYKVHFTNAFEMWSQAIPGEHLYNVVGVKNKDFAKIDIETSEIRNPRKNEGLCISSIYYLREIISSEFNYSNIVDNTKLLYNRMANGILDGAITSFDIGDSIRLSHLHIHKQNQELDKQFMVHNRENIPHILIGDFNIPNIYDFLERPPFSGKGYKSLLSNEAKTYGLAKGMDNFERFLFRAPDAVLANKHVENISTHVVQSQSDHDGIISKVRIL